MNGVTGKKHRRTNSSVLTPDGKLTPELIRPYLHGFGDQHHSQPGAIYLSHVLS
jgi:hypothetical protein